ncbi:DNA recombination protein RmuC [Streptococcus dysgalactiae subsp. equisimilis]|uniref:RmuC family DNA recombination protein n=1 Tax=Streptococcus dysgalactiae TaxID=1334 RepID=A0A9X9SI25_STRDY|nr:DNA recombination protein RmuC [Streptococcus dysgalactiae]MCL6221925.1 DNA recombination protein RmuC [Streptococcus dysgalactiae subsp. equisimilis]MDY2962783.1 DNA recombination protein RmuC [Streptococcus dysgalactiae]UMY67978.1 DNA recombination protein RmuC [Streptococcus dysgalactiae subsp. equisimilis]VTS47360.1 RmuC family DNA recombination protein [Streptococcus dysgalactiae subsp. equisimilis]VTS51090.1 RmuC family DNA recombination protein [Streptococcus dysgalactiae subsp. equi
MDLIMFVLVLVLVGLGIYLLIKLNRFQDQLSQTLESHADNLSDQMTYQLDTANKQQLLEVTSLMTRQQTDLYQQLTDIRDVLHRSLSDSRDRSDQRLEVINQQVNQSLKNMQESNEKRLEEMRQTVEEKLEETLKNRLHASFDSVSKQLESVNKGLGEMRTVAQDVGTLNKVLSNTKTRGILGELQLGQIIEDIMTIHQYEREFVTVSGSTERVEYAIKLPGNGQGDYIYLPIDSKFPLEDYYRLEDAYELGDKLAIENSRKALLAAIKRFAKDIRKKYLNPPETTNFGIMFLPTEGLYSEVVRNAAFFDSLRREENIVVAGPSTLSALLNSLSVGFKTLNIQKNADDISKILGNVKLEFDKFGGLLVKAQKQMNTANNTLEQLISTRTNAIVRALNTIETYQDQATASLLNMPLLEEENNEN